MKVALTILTLALLLASPHARAETTEEAPGLAVQTAPEALPAEDETPSGNKAAEPANDAPIPAVAVSVATLADDGPAPGSLDYEMSTIGLLQDAPKAEPVPKDASAVARR